MSNSLIFFSLAALLVFGTSCRVRQAEVATPEEKRETNDITESVSTQSNRDDSPSASKVAIPELHDGVTTEVGQPKNDDQSLETSTETSTNKSTAASISASDIFDLPNDRLDGKKQEAIWDAEHITFKLERRFGKHFKEAWSARDNKKLTQLMRAEATGSIIERNKPPTVRSKSLVTETHRSAATHGEVAVDAKILADTFCDWLADFDQSVQVGLRVLKIERISDDIPERWQTEVLLTANGTNQRGDQLAFDSLQKVTFQFRDRELLDGGPIIESWQVVSERLRACPESLMQEVTQEYGLADLPLIDNWKTNEIPQQFQFQMAVADYDLDGYLDIAIATTYGEPILLRSDRGTRFENVTKQYGFQRWNPLDYRYVAAWVDFDNDGDPDLILGKRIFRNDNAEQFVDVTESTGIRFRERPMGCAIADYDCDGLLDIYVLYQFSNRPRPDGPIPWVGDDHSGQPNELWKNLGDGKFKNVTAESGADGGQRNSFAAAWLFYNDDHFPDLYVANDFGTNVMLLNQGDGTFVDISDSTGLADYATSMGVAAGDINNDGIPELYVANMYSKMGRRIIAHVQADDYMPGIYEQIKGACAGNRLYWQTNNGRSVVDRSEELGVNGIGWAFAPAMADFDNDGLLDLYATTGFMSFDREKPDG